jgi:hypothetical protein
VTLVSDDPMADDPMADEPMTDDVRSDEPPPNDEPMAADARPGAIAGRRLDRRGAAGRPGTALGRRTIGPPPRLAPLGRTIGHVGLALTVAFAGLASVPATGRLSGPRT